MAKKTMFGIKFIGFGLMTFHHQMKQLPMRRGYYDFFGSWIYYLSRLGVAIGPQWFFCGETSQLKLNACYELNIYPPLVAGPLFDVHEFDSDSEQSTSELIGMLSNILKEDH